MKFLTVILTFFSLGSVALADAGATQIINELRAGKGRSALSYSPALEVAATRHAQDMARKGFFSHTGSNGSNTGQRVKAAGYGWCFVAENIAQGQKNLSGVMNAWANSASHRKNMLHRKARQFGLARGKGNTWVMVLAAPC